MSMPAKSFHLQAYLESMPAFCPEPLTPPHTLLRASLDLKHICAGYLNSEHTLSIFFRLIALTERDKHSIYRERFWRQYVDAGFTTQCWLVLAPQAAEIAREQLGMKPHQFAILEKSRRVDEHHAVLLMRVDQLVVAEWSHTGKCRFWYQHNVHAPNLFKKTYSRESLSDFPDYVQQHYFSAKGLWQKDAATWISSKAQIPILCR